MKRSWQINGFPRLLSVVDKGKCAFQPLLPFSSWLTSASLRLKRRKLLEYPSATGQRQVQTVLAEQKYIWVTKNTLEMLAAFPGYFH